MEPSRFEEELTRRELVNWCINDRDELKREFFILHPRYERLPPALWLEELLEALGHRVCLEPMADEHLGRWDAGSGNILINSQLSVVRRRSTMAHELGHSRLHHREIEERFAAGFWDDDGYEARRRRNRENEADLYAQIFLVSKVELQKTATIKRLLHFRDERVSLESRELWSGVYRLAKIFHVSPTMMMRSLVDLGWLEKIPSGSRSRATDLRLKWRTCYD